MAGTGDTGNRQEVAWTGRIGRGNSAGAGWLTLPAGLREGTALGDYYDLVIEPENQEPIRLTKNLKRIKKSWGFFLPAALCVERKLVGQRVRAVLERADRFPVTVSADNRVRLPAAVVEEHGIQQGDLHEMELEVKGRIIREVVLVTAVDRSEDPNRADEYYFTVRMGDVEASTEARVKLTRKVEKLLPAGKERTGKTIHVPDLFPGAVMGKVDERSVIIFQGNHVPIITPVRVEIEEIIHYFGHYYADGTKVGPGWSTGASTPEQAIYSLEKYGLLVLNNKLVYDVTFTVDMNFKRKNDEIKKELMRSWKKLANIELESGRIYLRESAVNEENVDKATPRKHNPIGSLRIRDNRGLVLELHLRLLEIIQSFALTTEDVNLTWQFLFGIIEGDGSVGGGKDRCRLVITCNKSDEIIPRLLKKVGIEHLLGTDKYSEQSPNTIDYSFGLIPILKNLSVLQKHLFHYYPKRRSIFVKRLLNTASVRYLLGEIDQFFPLALHPLKENDVVNDDSIIELLKELKKEIL